MVRKGSRVQFPWAAPLPHLSSCPFSPCILPGMARAWFFSLFLSILFPIGVYAQTKVSSPSFSDVPQSREEFEAVENLKRRGIIEGRPNGTFGSDDFVNRAEAVTIVVRAVANVRNLPSSKKCFPDVQGDLWFVRTVCYAKDLDWVAGYPDKTFQPVRTVAKGEFLKILLNAYGVDTDAVVRQWKEGLASDAQDPSQWYFPYLAYAVASSMTHADDAGNLNPGAALRRGQVALLVHRFLLHREGERTQALLTESEKDIRQAFAKLDALDILPAQFATARVRLMAWGALERLPDSGVVRATAKLGDALAALVHAYSLVQQSQMESALAASGYAYALADEADRLSGDVRVYSDRIRSAAHTLAEAVRGHQ